MDLAQLFMYKNMKVCLDSRLIKRGEYFVPVKGDNFDGHKFVDEVMAKGAAGIIEEKELYKLAEEKLHKTKPVVVGIAGSVGKSSMRVYMSRILATKYSVLEGDLNTKLGLATLIVNELNDQKIIIAELGIDRIGEMKMVTDFIKPDFSIISKLEKEHLQFLLSLTNVVNENLVSITNSKSKEGYINIEDKKLVEMKISDYKVSYYPDEGINIEVKNSVQNLELAKHEKDYLLGVYQICRDKFGFTNEEFLSTLEIIKKPKGRLNLLEGMYDSLILDDSYNAVADQSVIQGIIFGQELARKYKKELIVILSPMRETGESEEEQHKNVANYLNSLKNIKLIIVGDDKRHYGKYLTIDYDEQPNSTEFNYKIEGNELFYVKGSQFYRLEKIVYFLMKEKQKAGDLLVRQDARWK